MTELTVRQARTAIALERFRLRRNSYPEGLNEVLTENLLAVLPRDPMNNAPMEYERQPDGRVALRSRETERRVRESGVVTPQWSGTWLPAPIPK